MIAHLENVTNKQNLKKLIQYFVSIIISYQTQIRGLMGTSSLLLDLILVTPLNSMS